MDGYWHLKKDVNLWKLYGTSPQDLSTVEQRRRIGDASLGLSIINNYDIYKQAASYNNNSLSISQLEKLKKEMEGIKKLSGKDREKKIKNILEKKWRKRK